MKWRIRRRRARCSVGDEFTGMVYLDGWSVTGGTLGLVAFEFTSWAHAIAWVNKEIGDTES